MESAALYKGQRRVRARNSQPAAKNKKGTSSCCQEEVAVTEVVNVLWLPSENVAVIVTVYV